MSGLSTSSADFSGSPADVVHTVFSIADQFAQNAYEKTETFINALNSTVYTPPTISVTWESLAAPSLPGMPDAPTLPEINFVVPTGAPDDLVLAEPTFTIDDFTEEAPELTLPDAPTITIGTAPTIPSISAVTLPDAPTVTMPDAPTFLALSTPTFAGIDLHEDWLTELENIPTLSLAAPTPYSYTRGAAYSSALLTALQSTIQTRLGGGTGLDATVEQAIWDRARDRETQIWLTNEAEVNRQSEALGYHLPPGVLAAQIRQAQQDRANKLSELSRDVAIKQAELEQQNLKDAIAAGMQMESTLIDYAWKLETFAFESAKFTAENAIQVYNAQVENYKALLDGYRTYASAYDTIIKAELAKVDAFKALLDAERTKAEVNVSLVNAYKAEIEAGMAVVDIYKAQVSAAQTLVQLEEAKIGAAGEQIKAFVAQVNAETSKVEMFKAQVDAQGTLVNIFETKARAFSAKVGAQAERARAEISRYNSLAQAYASKWDGYKTKVLTEGERIKALGIQSNALLDGYKAAATATVAEAEMHTKVWEGNIKQYEAGQNIVLQTAKINSDALIQTNNARLDAAKVGAQVMAQMSSSAYSMMHASAGVSASASNSVGYSYSNDTTSAAPTKTAV